MATLPKGLTYRKAYEAFRPYVNFSISFRKPLSPAEQAKIGKYYAEFRRFTSGPYQVFKPKTKKRLEQAKRATGMPKGFPGFKVAFVPTSGEKVKVRLDKKGRLKISDKHVVRKVFLFSEYEKKPGQTLLDPEPTVNRIIKDGKEVKDFVLMCGEHEAKKAVAPQFLAQEVARFFETYGNAEKWFHGVIGYNYKNQKDITSYRAARTRARRNRK